jgi:hypothetical protein
LVDIHWEWMLSNILNVLRFLDSLYVLNTAICLSQLAQKYLKYGSQQPGGGSLGELL